MKRDPLDFVEQDEPARYQELAKVIGFYAVLFVLVEIDAGFGEQLDAFLRVHIIAAATRQMIEESQERNGVLDGKAKVELPGASAFRQVAFRVAKAQAQLNDPQ